MAYSQLSASEWIYLNGFWSCTTKFHIQSAANYNDKDKKRLEHEEKKWELKKKGEENDHLPWKDVLAQNKLLKLYSIIIRFAIVILCMVLNL